MSVNRRITWVWAAAFAAMVAAHAAVVFVPGTPSWIDTAVTIAALLGAFRFTARYPGRGAPQLVAGALRLAPELPTLVVGRQNNFDALRLFAAVSGDAFRIRSLSPRARKGTNG